MFSLRVVDPGRVAVTVTVVASAASLAEMGLSVRMMAPVGASSSSVMVKLVPVTESPLAVVMPVTETVSPEPSSMVSCVGLMEKDWVPIRAPAAMVSVMSSTVA